jgi:hypothetical protein
VKCSDSTSRQSSLPTSVRYAATRSQAPVSPIAIVGWSGSCTAYEHAEVWGEEVIT